VRGEPDRHGGSIRAELAAQLSRNAVRARVRLRVSGLIRSEIRSRSGNRRVERQQRADAGLEGSATVGLASHKITVGDQAAWVESHVGRGSGHKGSNDGRLGEHVDICWDVRARR